MPSKRCTPLWGALQLIRETHQGVHGTAHKQLLLPDVDIEKTRHSTVTVRVASNRLVPD
jgi:hypothetical protein